MLTIKIPYLLRRCFRLPVLVAFSVGLNGCGVVQAVLAPPAAPNESVNPTQIAAQLTLWALASAQPVAQSTATPVPLPTYTQPPTYTPLPTYTPFPTFTPVPTFTPIPSPTFPPALQPTALPTQPAVSGTHPYTLRVRNHFGTTYWIGTRMPYGGNYIKPLWYVEFYPPQPTWMRVWFCGCSSYFNYNQCGSGNSYSQNYWNDDDSWDRCGFCNTHSQLYNCGYRDVYVDQPFMEIGIP